MSESVHLRVCACMPRSGESIPDHQEHEAGLDRLRGRPKAGPGELWQALGAAGGWLGQKGRGSGPCVEPRHVARCREMRGNQRNAGGKLVLEGRLRISEPGKPRKTVGQFRTFMKKNAPVFRKYFGADLYLGSLNLHLPSPSDLQEELDGGRPGPSFCIPRCKLLCMAPGLGDGQAWRCVFECSKMPKPIKCCVFRRIGSGSGVDSGVIEILAEVGLVDCYNLRDGDAVTLTIFEEPNRT